jgi:hypothetical protein
VRRQKYIRAPIASTTTRSEHERNSASEAAILTMLADTMMREAFEHGGKVVGVATTLGFAVAFAIHTLD